MSATLHFSVTFLWYEIYLKITKRSPTFLYVFETRWVGYVMHWCFSDRDVHNWQSKPTNYFITTFYCFTNNRYTAYDVIMKSLTCYFNSSSFQTNITLFYIFCCLSVWTYINPQKWSCVPDIWFIFWSAKILKCPNIY